VSLASAPFILFVIALSLLFHLHRGATYRLLLLAAADAIFIASYVNTPLQLVPLLGFLVLGYACLQVAQRAARPAVLPSLIIVTLAVYVLLKQFSFLPAAARIPFPYLVIGLSYILFRLLHLIVDAAAGNLPGRIGPLTFFRYTCNLLTFVSGPIQLYGSFAESGAARGELTAELVYQAFSRIVTGYVKFAVIAACADYVFDNAFVQIGASPAFGHLVAVYTLCAVCYTIYLYYNFSGYMDIVIGLGWLLGQDLPENFDRPFQARSFLEFWQRWHMTLSEWFKTYLFNPLMMALMTCVTNPALIPLLGVVAFFVTFLVMGIWHGTTLVFVVYGLLMGLGASINKLWQIAAANRLGKKRYRALSSTRVYAAVARGMTIAYFVIALTCLWVTQMRDFAHLVTQLGLLGIALTFILLTAAVAIATLLIEAATAVLSGTPAVAGLHRVWPGAAWRGTAAATWALNAGLAARISLILVVISILNKPPEFVYKAF
jgi:D-alanyl-lipoteichoic acid acyltransferase DltB (MBOAT superfamily)